MTTENNKNQTLISRRQFVGSLMLASAGAAFFTGCSTSGYQIGCYTRAWGSRDYRISLDGMVEAGYKYVGLSTHDKGRVIDRNTSPDQAIAVGEEIKSRGLKLLTLSGGSFDTRESVETCISQLKRLIDNSVLCGSPVIQLNDVSAPEIMGTYYKVIKECCDYALEKGILLTLKPHGSTGAECRKRIEEVGHRNFKLWYDPGNVCFYTDGKVNPVEDAAGLGGIVVGTVIKDFRLPKSVNITPGTGMVDFPGLIAVLQKGGFKRGPVIVECLNDGDVAYINSEALKTRLFLEEITK